MRTILCKIGKSTALILPADILCRMNIDVGTAMELVVEGNRMIATPVERSPREGWEAAAAQISEIQDEEAEAWVAFANQEVPSFPGLSKPVPSA